MVKQLTQGTTGLGPSSLFPINTICSTFKDKIDILQCILNYEGCHKSIASNFFCQSDITSDTEWDVTFYLSPECSESFTEGNKCNLYPLLIDFLTPEYNYHCLSLICCFIVLLFYDIV
jgi:hypothetical protein